MAKSKLTRLKPTLSKLEPRIGYASTKTRAQRRYENAPWRRWKDTARWKRMRLQVFVRDGFVCCKCGKVEGDSSKLTADHITPHRGNEALFWDISNVQTVHTTWHNANKQQEEQDSYHTRGIWY
jgi:5-methylcytosine-specific restriction enzyme A